MAPSLSLDRDLITMTNQLETMTSVGVLQTDNRLLAATTVPHHAFRSQTIRWWRRTASARRGRLLVACVAVWLAVPLMAHAGPGQKKLIEYGVDFPSIDYTRQHIRKMEEAPFDGVVLRWQVELDGESRDCTHTFFTKTEFPPEAVRTAIEDLKATPFQRFTDNFLNLRVIPGGSRDSPDHHGDWFDDAWWQAIVHNAKAAAKVAREGGLKGILFDPEAYHGNPWSYADQKQRGQKGFQAYADKARERGRHVIKAINGVYPDLTIIIIHSTSYVAHEVLSGDKVSLEASSYGLLPGFIDGIIEASTPGTTLIDGFESAYPYTEYQQFVDARDLMASESAALSAVPEKYKKKLRVGFGLSTGHVTPEELQHTLRYALGFAHEYVWIWSAHNTNWWEGNVPKEYADVLAHDRTPITEDEIKEIERKIAESKELRERIRPPKVAVIYSKLHPGSASVYDSACQTLGWLSRAWENVDLDCLMAQIEQYDIVICQQNYNLANTQDFRKHRDQWLSFVNQGGIVLAMEVQESVKQLEWISDLGPDFKLKAHAFKTFQHGNSWKNPASELDFGFVKPTWGHFTDRAPPWVVTNRNAHDRPIIVYRKVGKGLLLASTAYIPYFPKAKHLETIWYRWKWQGSVDE